jgi:hypothetical protein
LRLGEDHAPRAFEITEQSLAITKRQVLRILEELARGLQRLRIALLLESRAQ